MGALAATAQRGRSVRGGLVARSAWRVLALLGFACAAVILFSTAANADSGSAGAEPASTPDSSSASKPGLVPGLVAAANAVLHPAAAPASAPAVAPITSSTPAATGAGHQPAPTHGAAAHGTLPILAAVASAPTGTVGTPAGPAAPLAPSLHDTLTPVVAAAAQGLTDTVDALSGTTSSLPVLGLATDLLRDAGTATTGGLVSTVDSLTTHLDNQLVTVVMTVGGGHRASATGPAPAPGASGPTAPPAVAGVPGPPGIAILGDIRLLTPALAPTLSAAAPGVVPASPRPVGPIAAVPAPSLVVAYAAPAFGAIGTATGTLPGPAAAGSTGGHEQTEVPRGFDFRTVMAIGRPAAPAVLPLPGTPLVDPGFSPD